jgi:hypothetical protein
MTQQVFSGLPEQSDELLNDQARANLENRDDVPQMYIMKNAQFPTIDGKLSEPANGIVYRVTGPTGSPVPGELDKPVKSKLAPTGLKAQASCGGFINTTKFQISKGGMPTQPLRRKKISIYDENPWLPSTLIFSGFTDDNGNVSYWQPYCDMGTFWDYTKPDMYYEINSADSTGLEVLNAFILVGQYTVRTPTYWEASQPGTITIDGGASDPGHALWVTELGTMALAFNESAGLNGASRFPVRIMWPSRDVLSLFGGTSHAYVSKIELNGADWIKEQTVWHEFGHELMYRTASPSWYDVAYYAGYASFAIPSFHWGPHSLHDKEIYDLAFNEGWGNYFSNLMYIKNFGSYFSVFSYCTWYCTNSGDVVWNVGGENESRVATLLTRYTQDVLQVWPSSISLEAAFGKVRSSMWNMGSYQVDLHDVWKNKIRNNQPPTLTYSTTLGYNVWSDSFVKTHNIATSTYMDLSRLPGNP